MLLIKAVNNVEEAEQMFNIRRTTDGLGLTIPSQRRYVRYFDDLLRAHYKTDYLKFIADYFDNEVDTINRIIPKTTLALKLIRVGPMKGKMSIQCNV